MKPSQLYLRCSCYSEVLVLDYWNDEDGELCISIYAQDSRRSWWWRLTDQIVLSKEDTKKVKDWLKQD